MPDSGGTISLDEIHQIVDAAAVNLNHVASNEVPKVSGKGKGKSVPASTTTTTSTRTSVQADVLYEEGLRIADFGKYKNKPYWFAYQDDSYVRWCINEVQKNSGCSRQPRELTAYFQRRRRQDLQDVQEPGRALMATEVESEVEDAVQENPKEQWMLAILDSGCNKTSLDEKVLVCSWK